MRHAHLAAAIVFGLFLCFASLSRSNAADPAVAATNGTSISIRGKIVDDVTGGSVASFSARIVTKAGNPPMVRSRGTRQGRDGSLDVQWPIYHMTADEVVVVTITADGY